MYNPSKNDIGLCSAMMVQCRVSVVDGEPTMNQHRLNVPCLQVFLDVYTRVMTYWPEESRYLVIYYVYWNEKDKNTVYLRALLYVCMFTR